MPDTIFKRNLNKFLCDLSEVNVLYFYHYSSLGASTGFFRGDTAQAGALTMSA